MVRLLYQSDSFAPTTAKLEKRPGKNLTIRHFKALPAQDCIDHGDDMLFGKVGGLISSAIEYGFESIVNFFEFICLAILL